ncbi:Zinc finger PHD-finger [Trinorchestia longiramus]|nr:Zinc finger PHD-finger [Trinorchestia longiramus]
MNSSEGEFPLQRTSNPNASSKVNKSTIPLLKCSCGVGLSMSDSGGNNDPKVDSVGLFLKAMVDREPGKRKVKASKAALIDLALLDMGDSSDDSDFNVDEAKLNDDDDISINSDPDGDDGSSSEDADEDEEESNTDAEEAAPVKVAEHQPGGLSVQKLLERAQQKQPLDGRKMLVCAVCLGDNSDDTNEIVTCDGWCHVSVHEGCYGVSDTVSVSSTVSSCSTEPWFCDACKAGVRNPPCELCPNLGYSIFKETETGRWVHLVCALYVPGVAFSEVDKLSFPTLFEMAYSRWGSKVCSLCEDARYAKTGVCIGCDAGMCRSYFHVTCAQREGLLSEVNHGEADQADPYYAHCKLHTDKELMRRRKRNWLTLQLHIKHTDSVAISDKDQSRLDRKLIKYREKYDQVKASRPTPWYPTQKMPRAISTCASLFRTLLHKTNLMGLPTETQEADLNAVGDIRKKWHVPPAFSVEFTSYYVDRRRRLKEMKTKLDQLLTRNAKLLEEEKEMKEQLARAQQENKTESDLKDTLLAKSLEMHNLLKGLAGRPLPLPPVVAAIHNSLTAAPPPPPPASSQPGPGGGRETRRLITKAAAKMIADPPLSVFGDVLGPRVSSGTPDQLPTSPVVSAAPPSSTGDTDASLPTIPRHTPIPGLPTTPPSKVVTPVQDPEGRRRCSVCRQTSDQHLQILCDTCALYYHLCCLDPPLTRMPKKTKQMGWQCSDCCRSSDSEKLPEVDTNAPRQLRRIIKEPAKFSPSVATEQKTVDRSPPASTLSPSSAPAPPSSAKSKPCGSATTPMKRRRSSDVSKKAPASSVKRARKTIDNVISDVAKDCKTKTEKSTPLSPGGRTRRTVQGPPEAKKVSDTKSEDTAVVSASGETHSEGSYKALNEEFEDRNVCLGPALSSAPGATVCTPPTDSTSTEPTCKYPSISSSTSSSLTSVSSSISNSLPASVSSSLSSIVSAKSSISALLSPTVIPSIPSVTSSSAVSCAPSVVYATSPLSVPPPALNNSSTTAIMNSQLFSSSAVVTDNSSVVTSASTINSSLAITINSPSAVSINSSSVGTINSPSTVTPAMSICSPSTSILDMSADTLPSLPSTLHSPLADSAPSHEEDAPVPSPRKEKRHRDGSKKKKKEKERDKEKNGEKRRKKHHHSYWPSNSAQTSEMLAPLRLKIKPLPPRPGEGTAPDTPSCTIIEISASCTTAHVLPSSNLDDGSAGVATSAPSQAPATSEAPANNSTPTTTTAAATTTSAPAAASESSNSSSEGSSSRVSPPPGYPNLPPGYTLTQPMQHHPGNPASSHDKGVTSSTLSESSTRRKSEGSCIATGTAGVGGGQQFSKCDVCGETGGVTNTVACDECHKAYHFNCLEPPLKKTPKRRGYSWYCEDCEPSK